MLLRSLYNFCGALQWPDAKVVVLLTIGRPDFGTQRRYGGLYFPSWRPLPARPYFPYGLHELLKNCDQGVLQLSRSIASVYLSVSSRFRGGVPPVLIPAQSEVAIAVRNLWATCRARTGSDWS